MKNRLTILLMIAAFFQVSCIREKLEVTYNKQEEKINSYIESALKSNPDYTKTHNAGSNRLTTVQGKGEELQAGGSITFYYAGYIFGGSLNSANLFATNHETSANNSGWNNVEADYEALTINLKEDALLNGVRNGLIGVKAGEECEILFSGKYGYGNTTFGIIPANSALLYKIWVVSITND